VVFNDFGFPPSQLGFIANVYLTGSNAGDVYNPTHPTFGNTYLFDNYIANSSGKCPDSSDSNYAMVDWVYNVSANYDLRNTMLNCQVVNGTPVFTQMVQWG